ncbi:MAG: hypothetical protein IJD64_05195, partial [Clostridia bacterium]|nr:hypothetical protein [Clostridia bacterium]
MVVHSGYHYAPKYNEGIPQKSQKSVKKRKNSTISRENERKRLKTLVQNDLGVVEAASSSLVTQTISSV